MTNELKGWHVLTMFIMGFGVIISVNLVLAFNAVRTFPGLEVKNSYVASQNFDAEREAQLALGWDVNAYLTEDGNLHLSIMKDNVPVTPVIEDAIFGRATSVAQDQVPAFVFDGETHVAAVDAAGGNWNLRLKARAQDGTLFQQRIVVEQSR